MSTQSTTYTGKVPWSQKIAFGLGMLANQMFPAVLGVFMVVLVEGLGFPTWTWAILYFLPRLMDAITDPIMGLITDNTRSKYGRRKQYVFLGALILGLSFALMWQLYGDNGLTFNFFYFLGFSLIFYLGLTIFSVPFVAMGYEMTDDFHERTNIMAVAQWIGQWAWVIAPWFWFAIYRDDWFASPEAACRELALWVAGIFTLIAIYPAIFVKSNSTADRTDLIPITLGTIKNSVGEIFRVAKEVFLLEPFKKVCISTFLIFGTFNTVASMTFFIMVHYMFGGDAGAAGIWPILHGSVGALVTTFLVIPIVAYLAKKIGKKRTFIVTQFISLIGYALFWFLFIPGKPYMFLFALPFFSFGIGGLFTVMMSMTSDICDLDELNSGKRREGIIGAIYWWMVKIGFAAAGLIAGLYMTLVGFDSNLEMQSVETITDLRFFYSIFPVIGTLIAIYIMKDYDLDEDRAKQVRKALEKKKAGNTGTAAYVQGMLMTLESAGYVEKSIGDNLLVKSEKELSKMFGETLNNGLHGLCFSPYLKGHPEDGLTADQITRRLEVIGSHTKWVRSFSCTGGNELIAELAHKKGLKTVVGAWISDDKERNEKELKTLAKLANQGFVDVAAIGNEVLMNNNLSETELLAYMKQAREMLPKDVPLTYVDAYYQFLDRPALIDACDIIMVNCYPFWEGMSNSDALSALDKMLFLTKQAAKGKKVIISETGWPSKGQSVQDAKPSVGNAMRYFINVQKWASDEDVELFYFSSFDETWKVEEEGALGARWGIWDKNEKPKYT